MEIIRNKTEFFKSGSCVALGNFDGIHIGHRALINECIKHAKENNLTSVVYTFEKHTSYFLDKKIKLITTSEEKLFLLSKLGIDTVYLEDFTSIYSLTPSEFCKNILVDTLHAKAVFCGENYTFGKNAEGNIATLVQELAKFNIKVIVIPSKLYEESTVSSTLIRNIICSGDTEKAFNLLKVPYFIYGEIVHGKKLGRQLGFPTVNISIPNNKITPPHGVYFTVTELDNQYFYSVSNVGLRPTVDSEAFVNCETHILDHNGDDYGKFAKIYFISPIRPEMKFESLEKLVSVIKKDAELARAKSKLFNLEEFSQLF